MTDSFEVKGDFSPAESFVETVDAGDACETIAVKEPNGFELLGLAPELLRAVEDLGYTQPTAVQDKAIPLAMGSRTEGDNAQAAMRVHRVGQTRPVLIRYATLAGTIDEAVVRTLRRKTQDIRTTLEASA